MTPVGGGVSSLNVHLRKELELYASLVQCFNVKGIQTRHDNVDIVVIRENSEGEYAGLEHEVVCGVVESLKVNQLHGAMITILCRQSLSHLCNVKSFVLPYGLFLESCREIAAQYPTIEYNEIIMDNCCMQLVSKPEQFDVTPSLYGNLVSNVAVGIAGGSGVMPGGSISGNINTGDESERPVNRVAGDMLSASDADEKQGEEENADKRMQMQLI
uniref:Isopropylmalate dehydrogenase-like domain-containing protein n=1 Tax=Chenopodium quinoa TaxID=63459 RepID=A0A803LSU1_CHEQI